MKVLKRGNNGWSMKIECTDCKSELEIEAEDVRIGNVSANPDIMPVETQPFVSCPVCNHYQTFGHRRAEIPEWVIRRANSKREP